VVEKKSRVSDYMGCPYPEIPEVKVEGIQGKEMEIQRFEVREGGFGPEVHVLCVDGTDQMCVRTTSSVVINQLKRLEDKLPIWGAFYRVGNYHTLR